MHTNQVATKKITVIDIGPRTEVMLIDVVIVVYFCIFAGVFIGIILMLLQVSTCTLPLDKLISLSAITISILFYIVPWSRIVQRIGKTALRNKIVGGNSQPPTTGVALLHYFGYYMNGLVASFGILWVNIDI